MQISEIAEFSRLSWVGQSESGLRVLCEPLLGPHFPSEVRHTEEDVLRSQFGFDEDMALLRVHLSGPSGLLQERGILEVQGHKFHSFDYIPDNLSARSRLMWITTVQGYYLSDTPIGHRSFLFWGEVVPINSSQTLVWRGSGLTIPLTSRAWSEGERGEFLQFSSSTSQ